MNTEPTSINITNTNGKIQTTVKAGYRRQFYRAEKHDMTDGYGIYRYYILLKCC